MVEVVSVSTIIHTLFNVLLSHRYIASLLSILLWPIYPRRTVRLLFPSPSSSEPTATIVCATVHPSPNFLSSIDSWLANLPDEIIIVTAPPAHNQQRISDLLSSLPHHPPPSTKIIVLAAKAANKRQQLALGFRRSTSEVTVIADDDTTWSPSTLRTLLSPFTHLPRLGAVFPEVQIRPSSSGRVFGIWEELARVRLFGDAIDGRISMLLDGGVFCGSGTTAAYRGAILKDEAFQRFFTQEKAFGPKRENKKLNAGDDQTLTRWLCREGWDVLVLPHFDYGVVGGRERGLRRGEVATTMRDSWRHFGQVLRWSRSDWLANLRAVGPGKEGRVAWRRQPFTAWTRVAWCLGSFTFVVEFLRVWDGRASGNAGWIFRVNDRWEVLAHIVLSRLLRYLPFLLCHYRGIKALVVAVLFLGYLYVQQGVKVWALLTLGDRMLRDAPSISRPNDRVQKDAPFKWKFADEYAK
ncbi:MAG: hypothetical protein Q9167_004202 [Letrouitia subvulpina]